MTAAEFVEGARVRMIPGKYPPLDDYGYSTGVVIRKTPGQRVGVLMDFNHQAITFEADDLELIDMRRNNKPLPLPG